MLMLSALLATGCLNFLNSASDPGGATELAQAERQEFEQNVAPLLHSTCESCHNGSNTSAPAFLQLMQQYSNPHDQAMALHDQVITWPNLVVPQTPSDSLLLSKGQHEGPAWTNDQSSTIRHWIEDEQKAKAAAGQANPSTKVVQVVPGHNSIPLDGMGRPGSIELDATFLSGGGFALHAVTLMAGDGGVKLTHPLAVSWDGNQSPVPDPADTFPGVYEAAGGQSALLGDAYIVRNVTGLSFAALKAETSNGKPKPPSASCKALASFVTNVKPTLAQCRGCHGGGNAGATAALDMSALNSGNDAGLCQLLLPLAQNGSGSLLVTQVAPNSAHPLRFQAAQETQWTNAVTTWINAEKAAP
jgi:hypothetical protein